MERFFKYHGLGNDFVILDRRASGKDIDAALSRSLCDRRRGIGGDGVLVLLPSSRAAARMVVHNSDGSVAEMCGNGLRCVAKHLADLDGARPPRLSVETGAGVLECEVRYGGSGADEITVCMGPAHWSASHLPRGPGGGPFVDQPVPGHEPLRGTAVSMGNPHLVLWETDVAKAEAWGPALERHALFPERTNVEFVQRQGEGLKLAVWERGAGLTQACGTGACATVAAGIRLKALAPDRWIRVELPGGPLQIRGDADLSALWLRGPAELVFEGTIPLKAQ